MSPGRVTGSTGASGISSSAAAGASAAGSASARSLASSSSEKPSRSSRQSAACSSPSSAASSIFVPPGVLADPVVREDVRALLRLAEVIEDDHRHVLQPQLPRGQQPSVAGDDAGVGVHQDRIVEPELHDARRNLGNLLVGMRPRIPGVWHQPVDRPQFDSPRHGGRDAGFSHQCCPPSEFGGQSTASLAPPSNFQSPGTGGRRRRGFPRYGIKRVIVRHPLQPLALTRG